VQHVIEHVTTEMPRNRGGAAACWQRLRSRLFGGWSARASVPSSGLPCTQASCTCSERQSHVTSALCMHYACTESVVAGPVGSGLHCRRRPLARASWRRCWPSCGARRTSRLCRREHGSRADTEARPHKMRTWQSRVHCSPLCGAVQPAALPAASYAAAALTQSGPLLPLSRSMLHAMC